MPDFFPSFFWSDGAGFSFFLLFRPEGGGTFPVALHDFPFGMAHFFPFFFATLFSFDTKLTPLFGFSPPPQDHFFSPQARMESGFPFPVRSSFFPFQKNVFGVSLRGVSISSLSPSLIGFGFFLVEL